MSLQQVIAAIRSSKNYHQFFAYIPYAQMIGMDCSAVEGNIVFRLKQQQSNVGNPRLPALHGGVVGGFMENTALCHIMFSVETPELPKTIDWSIDYLRPAQLQDTYATCEIVRHGKRVINASVIAWQSDRQQVIATARGHFLIA